eukprot:6758419-Pyramimonas_sp.AAC.1
MRQRVTPPTKTKPSTWTSASTDWSVSCSTSMLITRRCGAITQPSLRTQVIADCGPYKEV